MNKEQILEAIRELAKSQGFYGRLLEGIREHKEILDKLEQQNFKDSVDMVMWIES